jgi:transposase-like protein
LGDPEVAEKARRRQYPVEYKLRVLREADACTRPGEIGALLRREGLYSSLLSEWRRQRDEGALRGLGSRRRGPSRRDPLMRECERLRRENEVLRGKLHQAELIIEIQKKASEILGIPLRGIESEGSGS